MPTTAIFAITGWGNARVRVGYGFVIIGKTIGIFTCVVATILGIIAFRGVGAVGTREAKPVSPEEAGGSVETTHRDGGQNEVLAVE